MCERRDGSCGYEEQMGMVVLEVLGKGLSMWVISVDAALSLLTGVAF